jgi:hypothetical protein
VTELERALAALGRELEFPPAPDVAARVRERLRPRRRLPLGVPVPRRALLVALAAAAIAVGSALAVPQARSAILRFLHLGGVTIVRVDTLPPAQERPLTAQLGLRVPLAQVGAQVGFRPRLPRGERPAHGYVLGGAVSFVLRVRGTDVLLTEFGGAGVIVKKTAAVETRIEPVRVGALPGFWLSGRRHVVVVVSTPPRLAGNVLLWQDGDLGLRLEGRLSKDDALRLARGIR